MTADWNSKATSSIGAHHTITLHAHMSAVLTNFGFWGVLLGFFSGVLRQVWFFLVSRALFFFFFGKQITLP